MTPLLAIVDNISNNRNRNKRSTSSRRKSNLQLIVLTATALLLTSVRRSSAFPTMLGLFVTRSPFSGSSRITRSARKISATPLSFVRTQNKKGSSSSFQRMSTDSTVATTVQSKLSILDTPLGKEKSGAALLEGLDVFSVPGKDGHPLTVYGINSSSFGENPDKIPLLLLHGRTWSSIPVFHLLGGSQEAASKKDSRSSMEEIFAGGNIQPFAMDFRGFGGTPHDKTGWVEPNTCVSDVEAVMQWISSNFPSKKTQAPSLLGWSQGALVAQLVAQKSPHILDKLILYGSIYDKNVVYPRRPLYATQPNTTTIINTFDSAIEDFTVEGSIAPEPARIFAEAALVCDPIKAQWTSLCQFNLCDPGRVHVPTLLIAGDQDPYAPLHIQCQLFSNLGHGADRTWSIISDADHAVHLLDGRHRFVNIISNFVEYRGEEGKE